MKFVGMAAAAAVLSSAGVAVAHPGHGSLPSASIGHWLAEPLHAAPLALGLAFATWVALKAWRSRRAC